MVERKPSMAERWRQTRPTKTLVFWAIVASIVATMVVGFTWGGWVTGGTARQTAEAMSGDAVAKRLAPMCVVRFKADPAGAQKLKELTDVATYNKGEYVTKQGWATIPGEEAPDSKVAEECVKLLAAIK
jgi:hypothetical protein